MGGMSKVLRIAWREFSSTALTKGFIIGALLTPVIMLVVIGLIAVIVATQREPTVRGTVAIADPTGAIAPLVEADLSVEAYERRVAERAERASQVFAQINPQIARLVGGAQDTSTLPEIAIELLPPEFDLEAEKQRVREGGSNGSDRLALAVIAPNAIDPSIPPAEPEAESAEPEPEPAEPPAAEPDDPDSDRAELGDSDEPEEADSGADDVRDDLPVYGGFELFVRPKMDESVESDIRGSLIRSIRQQRFELAGEDPAYYARLNSIEAPRTLELTEDGGERAVLGEFQNFIPYAFMMLMLIPVFTGGQYLMTTTIEEKGSRVVEVLLSAISPMQLMGGKILGQMFVGLTIMVIYGGLGGGALFVFSLSDLIGIVPLVLMFVFFLLAYFTFAAFMAAIGAAVNELREAQSLLMPVLLPLMLPYALGIFIADDPNGALARITSFVPPINSFMMMLRVASTEPPPAWEVGLSLLVALVTCVAAVYFAAKVFRVGLLMHGKPPNFATLIRWIRMA